MPGFRLTHPKQPKLSENEVEKQCLDWLQWRKWWPVRIHTGTFKSADGKRWIKGADKGTPDYVMVHGRYPAFFLEVKGTGEEATLVQMEKHYELRTHWQLAVCTVASLEELAAWLKNHEGRG